MVINLTSEFLHKPCEYSGLNILSGAGDNSMLRILK